MSLLSKKDFAKQCDMTTRQLAVYISRKKVIESKGKKIDDEIPENKTFIDSRKIKVTLLEKKIQEEPADPQQAIERARAYERLSGLNAREKELKIERLDQEAELYKLKRQKLQGFLIPTELVKMLLAQNNKSITIAFQQAGEELILEISKKKSH